jgi:hypothetical protein
MRFFLLLFLLSFRLSAQRLDSCGLDNNPALNKYEAAYFNTRFQETRGDFSFVNKQLIFITGESGSVLGSKRSYFDNVKEWQSEHGRDYIGGSNLIPFTAAQRLQSAGHDAIVTYWTKIRPSPDRVIKRVNRKAGKQQYPLPN